LANLTDDDVDDAKADNERLIDVIQGRCEIEKDLAGQVSPNVHTKNGEVTLTAKGKSEAAHYLAIEFAKGFDHVTDVEDNLQLVKISTAPLSKRLQ
jgi:osmotically-inducible protein OsmY